MTKMTATVPVRAGLTGASHTTVSEKGGVSLYGLGRFPVTLYKAQWEKLLGEVDNIRKFLDENADKLAVKE